MRSMSLHRSITIVAGLTLMAVLACPLHARAQDTDGTDPPPNPDDPASVESESEPESVPGRPATVTDVETTDAWVGFSHAFATRLRAQNRVPDAVEEYVAIAALRPGIGTATKRSTPLSHRFSTTSGPTWFTSGT